MKKENLREHFARADDSESLWLSSTVAEIDVSG
jgi:hypothetical protein